MNQTIAKTKTELFEFLNSTKDKSEFKLEKIKFDDQDKWLFEDGSLSHLSKGFFHVTGAKNISTSEEHLVLFQPQSALTGLALYKDKNEVYVLLQARVEPGNSNICQYGPTIQSTPANYMQLHGGNKTSYADLFTSYNQISNPIGNNVQLDLGKRYFQKSKLHSYLEVEKMIDTEENMIWVPLEVIFEVLSEDNFLNADLRSLLSVFDWDMYVRGGQSSAYQENEFKLPISKLGVRDWKLLSVEELKGWEIRDDSIADVSNSGISVEMFKISCTNREVKTWSQPLMVSSNLGLVILFTRKINDEYEFLISVQSEFGITGQLVVHPSEVVYPGERKEEIELPMHSEVTSEIVQSDEGGRFYKNESLYQLVLVEGDVNIKQNQQWVSAEILKSILKASNQASFQLRCVASLALDKLNPGSL